MADGAGAESKRTNLFSSPERSKKSRKQRRSSPQHIDSYGVSQFEVGLSSVDAPLESVCSSSNEKLLMQEVLPDQSMIYRDVADQLSSASKVKTFCRQLFPQPLRNALLPPRTVSQWKTFLCVHLPILRWLWSYTPKQLIGDCIAGVTIGVTHVPQGIGFALLASLPPIYGLYSSFVPVLLYSFLGSSKHISVGTFPVVALMTGNAITRVTQGLDICSVDQLNVTAGNRTDDPCYHSDCEQMQVSIAVTLSLLVGILMILMSLLRLGFITIFLSDPLVSGYIAAAAFTIFITQLKFLFGFDGSEAAVAGGIANTPRRTFKYLELIFTGHINPAALITAIVCTLLLIAVDFLNRFLHKRVKKIPLHVPAQLIVVTLATSVSYAAGLSQKFALPVISDLGGIPPGRCFVVTHPDVGLAQELIMDAIIITIISFIINISQAKLLARKNGYSIHPDQELFAYGVMNMGGSFFGSFPTAGSLSRTVLQDATGGHTQLVGFVSSGIVIIVILFLGILVGPLPNAAVAAIVVVALKSLYLQVRDIHKYFKLAKSDMLVWLVAFFCTLLIGLDIGLGIGVVFNILVVIFKTILPFSPELGEAKAWHYLPNRLGDDNFDEEELQVVPVRGIYIYQFNSPLYFANVSVFRSKLFIKTGIDAEDMAPRMAPGCIQKACAKMMSQGSKLYKDKFRCASSSQILLQEVEDDDGKQQTGGEAEEVVNVEPRRGPPPSSHGDVLPDEEEECVSYHTIVIDCAPIGFTDTMGVAMLEQVVSEYDSIGVQVLLAAPNTPLCHALHRNRFFSRYSSERLFPTVAAAVAYAKDGNKVSQLEQPLKPDKSLASHLERQLLLSSARPRLLEVEPEIKLDRRVGRLKSSDDPRAETESRV